MQKFAAKLASSLFKGSTPRLDSARQAKAGGISKSATVIALVGELGAGKTTFTQGFLKALGVKHPVISPTFVLIRRYPLKNLQFTDAYHIDCYRLEKASELVKLGLKEILKNPAHLVLIEWPELIKKYLPQNTHRITIHHGTKKTERVIMQK